MLASWTLPPVGKHFGLERGAGTGRRGGHLAWRPGLESCHWTPGTAAEILGISAAAEILMGGSAAAGLAGRASAERGFQSARAAEPEFGEGPLHGKEMITSKFF